MSSLRLSVPAHGLCAESYCGKAAQATRKGDNRQLCWEHIMSLARSGTLSAVVLPARKTAYDPVALRLAIEACDNNIKMFEGGIQEQKDKKEELWQLLLDMEKEN